ncbi:DUF2510 domain-containing protein [Mycobacterium sp. NPDC003449]
MAKNSDASDESVTPAMRSTTQRHDPDYFARKAAESERKRRQIIADVARTAGPHDDIDFLTKRELYTAGLIGASELHATGSPELLPRGWYEHYVEALGEYCPARVFSLEEAGADAADLYEKGFRWMVVFSRTTGPRGDRTFIDVRSFAAAAMAENGQDDEAHALNELAHMGFKTADLPADIFMGQSPTTARSQGEGWHPDPSRRYQLRCWDGRRWTHFVATSGRTFCDPL